MSPDAGDVVVVLGIAVEDALEMPSVHDEEIVETLRSDSPHETLSVGVRVWRSERCLADLGTFRSKDLVEGGHVLRVTVADETIGLDALVDDVTGHVPGLLGDPGRIGMGGDSGDPDPSSMKNRT
jgi:hypothetical protein